MVKVIAADMRQHLYKVIRDSDTKIAINVDESTTLSQKSTRIVYLRCCLQGEISTVFVDLIELSAQDSNTTVKAILHLLTFKCQLTDDFLRRNLVAFCSDGASVMTGKTNGIGTVLKQKYLQLILWHCLAHRLELAVSDATDDVCNTYQLKLFIDKLHAVYTKSPKLLCQPDDVAKSVDEVVLTTRWVASIILPCCESSAPQLQFFIRALRCSTTVPHQNELNGMCKIISSKAFVENLLLMNDVLAELSMLSQVLQRS